MKTFPCLIAALSMLSTANAQTIVTDAFGSYLEQDAVREKWAGLRTRCDTECAYEDYNATEPASIEVYFGQKSMIVGKSIAMSIAIVRDSYGNLATSGDVTFNIQNGEDKRRASVDLGRAYVVINATEKAGEYETSAEINDLQTTRELYLQVPDIQTIYPRVEKNDDDEKTNGSFALRSTTLRDKYGNIAPNGLASTIIMEDDLGRIAYLPAKVVEGRAVAETYSSGLAGLYSGEEWLGQNKSPRFTINVEEIRLAGAPKIDAAFDEETKITTLRIKDLRTQNGYLVSDAVPFEISIKNKDGELAKQVEWTIDGQFYYQFAHSENPFPIDIFGNSPAGGFRIRVEMPNASRIIPHEARRQ